MNNLSRREFLALSFTPVLVPAVGAFAAASSNDAGLSILPPSSDATAAQPEEDFAIVDVCPGCGGRGGITCPACDGKGMWTEASESAGLYQREAARSTGHCAWCNDWGEAECPDCEGMAGIISESCPPHPESGRPHGGSV
jgi:anaerobic selenocysteine-containing dehydrogenase